MPTTRPRNLLRNQEQVEGWARDDALATFTAEQLEKWAYNTLKGYVPRPNSRWLDGHTVFRGVLPTEAERAVYTAEYKHRLGSAIRYVRQHLDMVFNKPESEMGLAYEALTAKCADMIEEV